MLLAGGTLELASLVAIARRRHLSRAHRLPEELLLVLAKRVDEARQGLGRLVGVGIWSADRQLGDRLLLLLLVRLLACLLVV